MRRITSIIALTMLISTPCLAYEYGDISSIFDNTETADEMRRRNEEDMYRQQESLERQRIQYELEELNRFLYDDYGVEKNIHGR